MMALLSSQPTFTRKGNGLYVMEINNRYFTIDEEVRLVMHLLSISNTYEEAVQRYHTATGEKHTTEDFKLYSDELLKKFELDQKVKSFLLVEKIILPPKQTAWLARVFQGLFQPTLFWITFLALILISLFAFFGADNYHHEETSFEVPLLYFMGIYFISIFLHELGHIAAARKFTGKNGGIGVGIYILYPIFFSDISAIWAASKQQKVITNLAGVYMQLWCAIFLYFVGTNTYLHSFQDFGKAIMFICFIQILPFLRSDGYWLLSDLTETPNLLRKSNDQFKNFFSKPAVFIKKLSVSNFLLFSYAFLNTCLILIFLYHQLTNNQTALLEFPHYISQTFKQLVVGDWQKISFDSNYIQVVLFYYLIVMYGWRLVKYIKEMISTVHPPSNL